MEARMQDPISDQALGYADILLGITTFNRPGIVAATARSLARARGVDQAGILVLDDASTEYDAEALRRWYPPHAEIRRRDNNSGRADYATFNLMRRFIEASDRRVLLVLDSDLLVAGDFLDQALEAFPRCQGLLSLFNPPSHPGVAREDGLLLKPHVGFAGTVWSREAVVDVLAHVTPSRRFDWEICERFVAEGRAILCLPDSAVQHLGLADGQNSSILRSDYGLSFTDTAWQNTSPLLEAVLFGMREEMKAQRVAMRTAKVEHDHALGELRAEIASLQRTLEAVAGGRLPRTAGLVGRVVRALRR
jgi:hypothetical protein